VKDDEEPFEERMPEAHWRSECTASIACKALGRGQGQPEESEV